MKSKITCLLLLILMVASSCSNTIVVSSHSVQEASTFQITEKEDIPASFFPDPIEIVSIGDSLTRGVGDSTDSGGYLPYLRRKLEKEPTITAVHMVNQGVLGNRTDQLLKRLDEDRIINDLSKADSVVITIGGNDIITVVQNNFMNLKMNQFDEARMAYEKRLNQILHKVRSHNEFAQIYVVGVYNPLSQWLTVFQEFDLIMHQWNRSSREIVKTYENSYFIEIGDLFENTGGNLLFTEDYFHPNDRGYELIAERIYTHMDIQTLGDEVINASSKGDEE
jgi:lysophospholipase L1-like esterase